MDIYIVKRHCTKFHAFFHHESEMTLINPTILTIDIIAHVRKFLNQDKKYVKFAGVPTLSFEPTLIKVAHCAETNEKKKQFSNFYFLIYREN